MKVWWVALGLVAALATAAIGVATARAAGEKPGTIHCDLCPVYCTRTVCDMKSCHDEQYICQWQSCNCRGE